MAGELSFFELGTGDYGKAAAFYSDLFSREFEAMGSGGRIRTPSLPGGIHGDDAGASQYVFFAVEDLEKALARVRELGGSGEPMGEDPDTALEFGRFALCKDDQGSSFGHSREAVASGGYRRKGPRRRRY